MTKAKVFCFSFCFSLLCLLAFQFGSRRITERRSLITIKAVYNPEQPTGFGQAARITVFGFFLRRELETMERALASQTSWQKGEIEVDVFSASRTPFLIGVRITHGEMVLFQGSLNPRDYTSDQAMAAQAAETIKQIIDFRAMEHPQSLLPENTLVHVLQPPTAPPGEVRRFYFARKKTACFSRSLVLETIAEILSRFPANGSPALRR